MAKETKKENKNVKESKNTKNAKNTKKTRPPVSSVCRRSSRHMPKRFAL